MRRPRSAAHRKGRARGRARRRRHEALGVSAIYTAARSCAARMTAEPRSPKPTRHRPATGHRRSGLREIASYRKLGRGRKRDRDRQDREGGLRRPGKSDPALVSPPGGGAPSPSQARALPVILRARHEHASGNVLLVSHKASGARSSSAPCLASRWGASVPTWVALRPRSLRLRVRRPRPHAGPHRATRRTSPT